MYAGGFPIATPVLDSPGTVLDQKLKKNSTAGKAGACLFALFLLGGLLYVGIRLSDDLANVHMASIFPFLLLGLALFIALGFEFVNGFHDTANAVATVIYTHTLRPHVAVLWSGFWNFVGVMTSSGAVAFAIISLLPVELILKASQGSGFAMIFSLLTAAILWNLVTWWYGLPASSSHTMIGSILGVGISNQLILGNSGTSGVDWEQVFKVFRALFISPLLGFALAALIFFLFKKMLRDPRLYEAPKGEEPPPFHIRALLMLTCTGVSFFHGSNDGQKGMGLIMLILVGTVPTAYALNHTVSAREIQTFVAVSSQVVETLTHYTVPGTQIHNPQADLERFISTKQYDDRVLPALRQEVMDIRDESMAYGALSKVPAAMQGNVRNQMYLTSETLHLLPELGPSMNGNDQNVLKNYEGFLDRSTKFIPIWVKVAVALALGLGTMVGWKRIVVTVGEKIGKTHLTYAQGAAAEITAMITIGLADGVGVPVSTTHVLSSGIAGTMAANRSGLQWITLRNILLAWIFTLPAAALLSGSLYWLFHTFLS